MAALILLVIVLVVVAGSSSSGRRVVAYVSGRATSPPQIWVANASGGDARRLGPGDQPLVSPNGSLVAASSSSSRYGLSLYPTSGDPPRRFFDGSLAHALPAAFSPDSRYLAVTLSSADPASDASSGLAILDTRTFSYRIIARGPIEGASFSTDGSDRIVYAAAESMSLAARVDLHVSDPDGTGSRQLTDDGRSLNPVWGPSAIAFDHETIRRRAAPLYEVWLMAPGGGEQRQLTHLGATALLDGLVPLAFSRDQRQLLAEYEGQNTSQAWSIALADGQARELQIAGQSVAGEAISRSGESALVDRGGYLNPPDMGVVEELPLHGGRPRTLISGGAEPSWNL